MSQFELRIPSKLRGATRPSHLRLLRTRPSFPALWDERDATSAGFTTVDAAAEYAFKSTEFKVARIINDTHFFQTHNEPQYRGGWCVTFVMWGSRRRVQETELSSALVVEELRKWDAAWEQSDSDHHHPHPPYVSTDFYKRWREHTVISVCSISG